MWQLLIGTTSASRHMSSLEKTGITGYSRLHTGSNTREKIAITGLETHIIRGTR